jgi:hypothetical protein
MVQCVCGRLLYCELVYTSYMQHRPHIYLMEIHGPFTLCPHKRIAHRFIGPNNARQSSKATRPNIIVLEMPHGSSLHTSIDKAPPKSGDTLSLSSSSRRVKRMLLSRRGHFVVAPKSIQAPPERLKARRLDYVISLCTSVLGGMQIYGPISDFVCDTLRTRMIKC